MLAGEQFPREAGRRLGEARVADPDRPVPELTAIRRHANGLGGKGPAPRGCRLPPFLLWPREGQRRALSPTARRTKACPR